MSSSSSNDQINQIEAGHILGLGIPLLDIIAEVDYDFLHSFDLQPNNVIRVEREIHEDLCESLNRNYSKNVKYIAGGAVQNSMRVAQWFFPNKPNVTTFFGGVGNDEFGTQMKLKAEQDNVTVSYYVDPVVPTGTCACLLTENGKNRSLCAYFGASELFNLKHLQDNFKLVNQAKILYVSGFHLAACFETSFCLAAHVFQNPEKQFVFNLSAVYVSQKCSAQLSQIIPYVDLLFGNDAEARAFAQMKGWMEKNLEKIVQKLADVETRRPRTVVITQGHDDILVAFTGKPNEFKRFKVDRIPESEIRDTNGAGDAFVGGFLAMKAIGKDVECCVQAGIYAAKELIKMTGCELPKENTFEF